MALGSIQAFVAMTATLSSGAPAARWFELTAAAAADEHHPLHKSLAASATAPRSMRAHFYRLRTYWKFLQQQQQQQQQLVDSLVFSPLSIKTFIEQSFERKSKTSTLRAISTSISWLARLCGLPNPTSHTAVQAALRGAEARQPLQPRYNEVFDLGAFLRWACDTYFAKCADTPPARWPEQQLRDACVLFTRAMLGLRSSCVTKIVRSSVVRSANGDVTFRLLPQKQARGAACARLSEPYLLRTQPEAVFCPAALVLEYAERIKARASSSRRQLDDAAPLFVGIGELTPLTSERVSTIVRRIMRAAPADIIDPRANYSPHSLKAALVSFLRAGNHSIDDIARTVHASSSAVLALYYDKSAPAIAVQRDIASTFARRPSRDSGSGNDHFDDNDVGGSGSGSIDSPSHTRVVHRSSSPHPHSTSSPRPVVPRASTRAPLPARRGNYTPVAADTSTFTAPPRRSLRLAGKRRAVAWSSAIV
jgi:hypothetical protein